jgi:hypothetical protein
MPEYKLYARDSTLSRVAQIDDYQRLDMTLRFNAVGSWSLDINPSLTVASLLQEDGAGLIVMRDDDVLLSGVCEDSERDKADKDKLTIFGVDDMGWLARRMAYPVPLGAHTGAEYDVRTGAAETIIREYVNLNAGPGAIAARRVPGLTLAADGGLGSVITGRARFDNLLEFIASLALQGGDLGFVCEQLGAGLVFAVYEPRDLTASVIFSRELGNVKKYNHKQDAPTANYIICGGEGEGTARTFAEAGDATSIAKWGRIERFLDYNKTTDSGELSSAIAAELEKQAERFSVTIQPIDTAGVSFMTHWQLGDIVTFVAEGVAVEAMIRAVKVEVTPTGSETVTPILATPGTGTEYLKNMIIKSSALRPRVGLMERR